MLELLGIPQFDGKPLSLERALYMVALLICHQTPMARDELMLLLWSDDSDEATVKQRLRQLVYRTKHLSYGAMLETSTDFIAYTGQSDLMLFRQAIQQRHWENAIPLYKGEFLHGATFDHPELEEYFLLERDTLRGEFVQAALTHATTLEPADAAHLLENAMHHDPQNEDLLRALLEYAKAAPDVGMRAFERYSKVLMSDLGLEPPSELQDLMQNLGSLAPTTRSSLPIPTSDFVGRHAELEEISRLLENTRLLTLLGVGGIGKTRLSLEVATRQARPAYFVDLARLQRADLVASAILETLGERAENNATERLHQVLANRRVLLVLDNFEHVLPARDLVVELLKQHPQIQIIVTSRERLNLAQEQVFELGGMPAPDTLFPLETQDAALIFLRAAQRSQLDFSLQNDVEHFSRIYRVVAGMPLGLELSASWVRTLSLQEIAEELENSLDVLAVDSPDMPERHRSFAAVFSSSWQLLSAEEQGVLAQLSMFRGGFDKEMAQKVCHASLTVLLKLVNKSLVSRREQRFVLHELVRQYSEQHLKNPDATLERLGKYLLAQSEEWYQHKNSERQTELSQRLELDHDNIRAVLNWSLIHSPAIGAGLAGNLEHFWYTRGYHKEGFDWAGQFLQHYNAVNETQLRLLWTRITIAKELSNYPESRENLDKYQKLASDLQHANGLASAEKFHGLLEREQGNLELGKQHLENAKAMYSELGDSNQMAICLNDLGIVHSMLGDNDQAKSLFTQSLELKRLVGDKMGVAYAIGNLGVIAGMQGDFALERVLHAESLQLKRELGDKQGIGNSLQTLGLNALQQHNIAQALEYLSESLTIFVQLGRRWTQTVLLFDFAKVAWELEASKTALEFAAAAIQWRYAIRSQPAKHWLEQQKEWQTQSALSPAELARLEFDVQKKTLEQMVQQVLAWKETQTPQLLSGVLA